jgi:hypothetical protein
LYVLNNEIPSFIRQGGFLGNRPAVLSAFQLCNPLPDSFHGRLKFGVKPGLLRMEKLMEKLEHPEKNIRAIHAVNPADRFFVRIKQ